MALFVTQRAAEDDAGEVFVEFLDFERVRRIATAKDLAMLNDWRNSLERCESPSDTERRKTAVQELIRHASNQLTVDDLGDFESATPKKVMKVLLRIAQLGGS